LSCILDAQDKVERIFDQQKLKEHSST